MSSAVNFTQSAKRSVLYDTDWLTIHILKFNPGWSCVTIVTLSLKEPSRSVCLLIFHSPNRIEYFVSTIIYYYYYYYYHDFNADDGYNYLEYYCYYLIVYEWYYRQNCFVVREYKWYDSAFSYTFIVSLWNRIRNSAVTGTYSRLSLSQIPRDSLKLFEISVPRNIRVAEVRKTWNQTTSFNNEYVIWLLKLETYWKYCGKEEKLLLRSNFSSFLQYFVICP